MQTTRTRRTQAYGSSAERESTVSDAEDRRTCIQSIHSSMVSAMRVIMRCRVRMCASVRLERRRTCVGAVDRSHSAGSAQNVVCVETSHESAPNQPSGIRTANAARRRGVFNGF